MRKRTRVFIIITLVLLLGGGLVIPSVEHLVTDNSLYIAIETLNTVHIIHFHDVTVDTWSVPLGQWH